MKIIDVLWWIFSIGNEPTSPDAQHAATRTADKQNQAPDTHKLEIDEPVDEGQDLDEADFDEFNL